MLAFSNSHMVVHCSPWLSLCPHGRSSVPDRFQQLYQLTGHQVRSSAEGRQGNSKRGYESFFLILGSVRQVRAPTAFTNFFCKKQW